MTEVFDFDYLQPRTWGDAFPWLSGTAGTGDSLRWSRAISETDQANKRDNLVQIAELAMQRLSHWTIGSIFPGLSPEIDLLQLHLPVRAINALTRFECGRSGDLMVLTLDNVLSWRQVGVGTVDAILQTLADVSTSFVTPSVTSKKERFEAASVLPPDEVRPTEWMWAVNDDLTRIATWFATIGLPGQAVLGDPLPPGTPDEVLKARQRLECLSADQILNEGELKLDIAGRFDVALRMLDPRAAQILGRRLFADEPVTLDRLAGEHGVTRERIRQIEGKARGAMLAFISEGGALADVAESARTLIGTIRPLNELLELIPALGKAVETVGQPAWRVLDRLDDGYEIEDGWCVMPTMTAAETTTQTSLQERANQYGVVRLDEFDLIQSGHPERLGELRAAWIGHCGYIVDGEFVLSRTQSVGDYAAAVLSIEGSPLRAQEIVDRFVFERSVRSLANALSGDDRFERVDRDRWALKEWGLDAYSGIRSIIRQQVAEGGGRAKLSDIIEFITARYSVSGSSVAAYAGAAPFGIRDGKVQLATAEQGARRAPERTRRLFRRPDGWAYRVRISTDHLRGSGSVAPQAIATVLDLHAGETRQLDSPLGPQAVAWTGPQPSFGTIRRFLMKDDMATDSEAFLVIHEDHSFTFEQTRELIGDPLADALSLVGAPPEIDREAARTALARALSLPDESPASSIIGGYRERGDNDVAELLLSIREQLEAGYTPSESRHSADVNEILGLL
ncbi:sigma factor-like helix-turn-helix DNA-binding protein [Arthrobacter sp. PAMC25284]|uniref:sigma factor-like helix-turn-helix DNA-binding protein n=1 Tax=Arthrobacter sp. PAMC25284 TaxID=2861279 RepID=UPI001C6335FE|nr:sigma factor-like helix-turn-helix DNA-binding protein [Arthrobacter sp. PAMC25284]QYF91061.1 hypothetical protein KY499_07695 [Arthrobacter sp. PAMC25284]